MPDKINFCGLELDIHNLEQDLTEKFNTHILHTYLNFLNLSEINPKLAISPADQAQLEYICKQTLRFIQKSIGEIEAQKIEKEKQIFLLNLVHQAIVQTLTNSFSYSIYEYKFNLLAREHSIEALAAGFFAQLAYMQENSSTQALFNLLAFFALAFSLLDFTASYYITAARKKNINELLAAQTNGQKTIDLFERNHNGQAILFTERSTNRTITADLNTKHISANPFDNNMLYDCIIYGKSLNYIYTPPSAEYFGGKIANLQYIVDGHTDFSGNLLLLDGEILTMFDNPFAEFIKLNYIFIIGEMLAIKDPNPEIQAKLREIRVLEILFWNVSLEIFAGIEEQYYAKLYSLESLQSLNAKIVDLDQIIEQKLGGFCRHKSLFLAKIIYYFQQCGLISGEIKIRLTRPTLLKALKQEEGHAWLEYRSKYIENDYLVLDPMKYIFGEKTKLKPEIQDKIHKNESNIPHGFNNTNYQAETIKAKSKRRFMPC